TGQCFENRRETNKESSPNEAIGGGSARVGSPATRIRGLFRERRRAPQRGVAVNAKPAHTSVANARLWLSPRTRPSRRWDASVCGQGSQAPSTPVNDPA